MSVLEEIYNPGIKEEAWSLYDTNPCLVGFASKGPIGIPTQVSSQEQLYNFFGASSDELPLIAAAEQILAAGAKVLILRVADESEIQSASVEIPCESVECCSFLSMDCSFVIQSESHGTAGNNITIDVKVNKDEDDTFDMCVFENGHLIESWRLLSKNKNDKMYFELFVNLASNWIKVIDNCECREPPKSGTYKLGNLVKGKDGIPSDQKKRCDLLIGGIYKLAEYDIDLVAIPGENSLVVLNELINFCEDRGNCLAIIDAPKTMSHIESIKWKRQFNKSDCAAVFWPWVKVWNAHGRKEIWVPPSGSTIATLVKCDSTNCIWASPSGINRGIVSGVLETMYRPKYDKHGIKNEHDLNVIINKNNMFFLQNELTLSGRKISLKRLAFFLKKLLRRGIDNLLRDCRVIDDYFASNFIRTCDYVLTQVKRGQGIQHYHIVAGDEINTPEVRAKGNFKAQIGVQPINTSIWINFEFSINETGVASKKVFVSNRRIS